MTFRAGYLTSRETGIWDLRRKGLGQSEIGRRLEISRQAVHKALSVIDSKVERALTEAAEVNMLDIISINLVDGVMEAHSPAYDIPVVVSLSEANGLRVWYLYEGKCASCGLERSCRRMLEAEARERGIDLSEADRRMPPTRLALRVFSRFMGER